MNGSGARDGLHRRGPLLLEGRGVGAENQLSGLGGELRDTSDRGVFVVQFGVVSENLVSLCMKRVALVTEFRHGRIRFWADFATMAVLQAHQEESLVTIYFHDSCTVLALCDWCDQLSYKVKAPSTREIGHGDTHAPPCSTQGWS